MRAISLILVIIIAVASVGEAQRRGGRGGFSARPAEPQDFDGLYQFCRVAFRGNRAGDGGGWGVDYPRADINVSIRLSELTKANVSFAGPDAPESRRRPAHRRDTVPVPDGDDDRGRRGLHRRPPKPKRYAPTC